MIYLFTHDEELKGQLNSAEIMNCHQEENLNGLITLDLEISLKFKDKMDDVEFVAHEDVNNENEFYLYKLISIKNTDNSYCYTAINIAYDDFKGYGYLREYRMQNTTAQLALETILSGSRWVVGVAENTLQRDLYIYDLSRLEALGKLIDTFNVELEFKVVIKGNKIIKRYVNLYTKMGYITNKRFVYGHNALNIVREEDQQNIYTAGIGRGKGEEKFDSSGESTGAFGRRIDFKDVEWKKENGDPVDKPLGQEYVEIKELTKKYGYSDGTPRFKIVKKEKIEDPAELLQAVYDDLVLNSRPLVQFEATINNFGIVHLGDTVNVIRHDLNIYYTTRVFKITRNLLDPLDTIIELGDNLEYNQNTKNKQLVNNLKELNSRVTEVAESANLTFTEVIKEMREGLENSYFNDDGYNYEFKAGNEYGLPAGYYSFDRPIDQDPTKVIYMGAGKMAIANKKDSNGKWDFQTFGTGDGLLAESIVGTLGEFAKVNANQINVNDDFAKTQLGKNVVVQGQLYNNVKITGAKGIQVLDNEQRERVQIGNWSVGRYGLNLKDASGNQTILDDQGILQSWQDGRCDNADNGHPLRIPIYIPKEAAQIYKAFLRLYVTAFRAYSKATSTVDRDSSTTSDGGFQNAYGTAASGGGRATTSHGSSNVDSANVWHTVYKSSYDPAVVGAVEINKVRYHEHIVDFPDHSHSVNVSVSSHSHSFTIPGHSHEIIYGIYEENNSDNKMEIYINGSDRTSKLTGSGYFGSTQTELDITNYLNKGTWNIIEIRTSQRMRIDATVFIQALLNYGGY